MSFFGITDFWAYLLGVIAIVILPGPNSMYCLFAASSRGILAGYKAAMAIFLGDLVLMVSAVLGGAAILTTSPTVFLLFKALGGLYLAYLGSNLLFGAYKRIRQGKPVDIDSITNSNHVDKNDVRISDDRATIAKNENVFMKALMLSLSNPKAILFFLSFFLQFVDPNYDSPMLSFAILGLTLQVVSMIYLSVLIFAGTGLSAFFRRQYLLSSIGSACVGLLFIGFAISLWMSRV